MRWLLPLGLLLALVLVWLASAPDRGRRALTGVAPEGGDERQAAALVLDEVPLARGRVLEEATPAAPEGPLDGAVEAPLATFAVRVTDTDGVPAAGIEVLAAPPRHVSNRIGWSDESGRLAFTWRPRRWPAELVVELRGRGGASLTGLRRFVVGRGETAMLELTLTPALLPEPRGGVRWEAPDGGSDGPSGRFASDGLDSFEEDFLEEEFEEETRRSGPLIPSPTRDAAGHVVFVAGGRLVEGLQLEVFDSIEWSEEINPIVPVLARVAGRVDDERGAAAAGVRVAAEHPDGWTLAVARTDREGRFQLDVDGEEVVLRAGLGERVVQRCAARGALQRVRLERGGSFDWSPRVERGPRLVRDAPSGLVVELSTLERGPAGERLRVALAGHAPAGPLELAGLAGAPWTQRVLDAATPARLSISPAVPIQPAGAPLPPVAEQVDLAPSDLRGAPAGEVRVWEPDRRRGTRLPVFGERDAVVEVGIPAGPLHLSLGSAGAGWSEEVFIDAGSLQEVALLDLGFGPLGTIVLQPTHDEERAAALPAVAIVRDHAGAESLVLMPSEAPRRSALDLELPAGEYAWIFSGHGPRPFRLAPGARVAAPWDAFDEPGR